MAGLNEDCSLWQKAQGIPVHYYIPPKSMGLNQKRAIKLKAITDQYLILIFTI